MRRLILLALIMILSVSLFGCMNSAKSAAPNEEGQAIDSRQSDSSKEQASVIYKNDQYGFEFSLPESWTGYKIVSDKWEGLAVGGTKGEAVVEVGPMLSIRHPEWTAESPRQDIPIMIFTQSQWNLLQQDKFHIGAAPIGPSELGRNAGYIFALPARYNFAFPKGYEEVENILQGNPLKPIDITSPKNK